MKNDRRIRGRMDFLYFLGALVVYFVLMRWVLPRFGVST
jgi:hypothetical protein